MKPPKLNDDAALAEFIADLFLEREAAAARDEAERDHPPLRMSDIMSNMEAEAIEAAEDGNFEPIANMIENPFFRNFNWVLSPRAAALIAAKLRDEVKSRRGPKRQPRIQRELDWKVEAAEEVDEIVGMLKYHYPNETGHTDRAIDIAYKRAKERSSVRGPAALTRQKLESYYLKSRHRRRRPHPT